MLFNSLEFIFLFLPLTWVVFFFLTRFLPHSFALVWLSAASLFFYAWWNPIYLPVLLASVLTNFIAGLFIDSCESHEKRTWITGIAIALNLGLLGYFKYTNFLIDQINNLADTHFAQGEIILPLAISFHTFQQIAYLVDIFRRQHSERNFVRYLLFVTFFPQLIAGPIIHHRELLPQLSRFLDANFKLSLSKLGIGFSVFIIGLFKKVLIADTLALYATPVFKAADLHAPLSFLDAWGGALAYTFQIYFDFSAYSEMAVGLGFMFGLKLPFNFAAPYTALNIIDFWRRWHMTLSRFLRDYLYIPLGGNRCSLFRRYANLMLTMLLGGLWHGAGWTFVFWGFLHGFYLVVNHAWAFALGPRLHGHLAKIVFYRGACWTLTFLAVSFAWVFFRAETFAGALHMTSAMFGVDGVILPGTYEAYLGPLAPMAKFLGVRFEGVPAFFEGARQYLLFTAILATIHFIPCVQTLFSSASPGLAPYPAITRPGVLCWNASLLWAVALALIFAVSVFLMSRDSEFLYFQF